MTAYDRKKNTFISKLLFAFRPKHETDIVAYADKILDDYTGVTMLRTRKRDRKFKRFFLIFFSVSFILTAILCVSFKIFF